MATSLAAMTARRAATFARLSSPGSAARSSSLIPRRGLAGAADHHGPARVDCWKDPMSPSKWKEEHVSFFSLHSSFIIELLSFCMEIILEVVMSEVQSRNEFTQNQYQFNDHISRS
ncbi:unnamed protein product [Fraxinus pennsylvanica]|uniref:Uncharacterized protein n=1 Tax=Fraxinus pennsylvanica TaxID=56036 RepID=A0AAD1ZMK2_9LAMI|nr:unnamed protein product [Fraxinus pennsylvanica]